VRPLGRPPSATAITGQRNCAKPPFLRTVFGRPRLGGQLDGGKSRFHAALLYGGRESSHHVLAQALAVVGLKEVGPVVHRRERHGRQQAHYHQDDPGVAGSFLQTCHRAAGCSIAGVDSTGDPTALFRSGPVLQIEAGAKPLTLQDNPASGLLGSHAPLRAALRVELESFCGSSPTASFDELVRIRTAFAYGFRRKNEAGTLKKAQLHAAQAAPGSVSRIDC
jgi:hypothetical protein